MFLVLVLVVICHVAHIQAGCTSGGCVSSIADVQASCPTTVTRTRLEYYRTTSWWGRTSINSRQVQYEVDIGSSCCPGFVLIGRQCYKNTCGGCGGSSPRSQRACRTTRQVTSKRTRTEKYGCGWWKSCYRTVYYTQTTSERAYVCCTGYAANGQLCAKQGAGTDVECGLSRYPDVGQRLRQIAGGLGARPNEFPWQVLIRLGAGAYCGGTVLSEHHILTAAHCVYNRQRTSMTVLAGKHHYSSTDSSEQSRGVAVVYSHRSYDVQSNANDIAVLLLATPLTINDNVRPACLPAAYGNFVGRTTIISGWGKTADGTIPATLQFTKVQVTSKSVCAGFYGPLHHVLCGTDGRGDTSRSPCAGDSGSPMALESQGRYQVIGVSSFGSRAGCAAGRPFGYTDVSRYTAWIKDITGL